MLMQLSVQRLTDLGQQPMCTRWNFPGVVWHIDTPLVDLHFQWFTSAQYSDPYTAQAAQVQNDNAQLSDTAIQAHLTKLQHMVAFQ